MLNLIRTHNERGAGPYGAVVSCCTEGTEQIGRLKLSLRSGMVWPAFVLVHVRAGVGVGSQLSLACMGGW